ncbi:unnamed protein product [Darwinula stevensoni]|uniref:Regulatory protein zeste n=1 Tax=Darwinula stevensoni TaxID=69355 RepID=A0A7R8XFN8_9CRUS|nr:unnamed protein product [Darwinula stevensoni]CAG0890865.1 unnamed protein product [Darwinula stevensoni]
MNERVKKENYSSSDEVHLAEIVKEHPEVESRRYDADSLHKKNHAWKMIHEAYNSSCPSGNTQSLDQLKGLWNRLKVKTTQDRDQQGKEAKTGGGE